MDEETKIEGKREKEKRLKEIFQRVEQKYVISKTQYDKLMNLIGKYLEKDEYYKYTIKNIYYDNDRYGFFRKSIEKPIFKVKLRLRGYNNIDLSTNVFLELKKKYDGIVYKRRIVYPLDKIYQFIKDKKSINDTINEKEILYMLQRYDVKPKVFLSYDRESFVWREDKECRITFDSNLQYQLNNVVLESKTPTKDIVPQDTIIMELKSIHNLPLEFVKALSALEIYPHSFSKIGTVYIEHILKGEK